MSALHEVYIALRLAKWGRSRPKPKRIRTSLGGVRTDSVPTSADRVISDLLTVQGCSSHYPNCAFRRQILEPINSLDYVQ